MILQQQQQDEKIAESPRPTRSVARKRRVRIGGVVVGRLIGLDEGGNPNVDYRCDVRYFVRARSTVSVTQEQVGREVVLMFEDGDPERPVIMGLLQASEAAAPREKPIQAKVDGETITFRAERELALKCGKASITLTPDGKVQIRGAYLLSQSSGVNRIQGGSIELN